MKIKITDIKPSIDALEFAINQIYQDIGDGSLHDGPTATNAIAELQMIRVAYMLAHRNGTRASTVRRCKFCGFENHEAGELCANCMRTLETSNCTCKPDTTMGVTHQGDCNWWISG